MEEAIKQIAIDNGILQDGKLISYSKFKKLTDPNKFTNNCYQVYLGSVGRLIHYKPYVKTRSKESANRMFYDALDWVLVKGVSEAVEDGDLSVREKYSIMW